MKKFLPRALFYGALLFIVYYQDHDIPVKAMWHRFASAQCYSISRFFGRRGLSEEKAYYEEMES